MPKKMGGRCAKNRKEIDGFKMNTQATFRSKLPLINSPQEQSMTRRKLTQSRWTFAGG